MLRISLLGINSLYMALHSKIPFVKVNIKFPATIIPLMLEEMNGIFLRHAFEHFIVLPAQEHIVGMGVDCKHLSQLYLSIFLSSIHAH